MSKDEIIKRRIIANDPNVQGWQLFNIDKAMDEYAGEMLSRTTHVTDTTTMPEIVFNTIHNNAIQQAIEVVKGEDVNEPSEDYLFQKLISKLNQLKK